MKTTWANPIYFEYTKAANPQMPPILANEMTSIPEISKSNIVPIDLSGNLGTKYPATSPVCLVSFINLMASDKLKLANKAVSNLFVIIKGEGVLDTDFGKMNWGTGDIVVVPYTKVLDIYALKDARVYWVTDEPIVNYLGVVPTLPIFDPVCYPYNQIKEVTNKYNQEENAKIRNRNGVLLSNPRCPLTKTISPTLWALFNVIEPNTVQAPHQHNSVALDLCFSAKEGVYTLLSKTIDDKGNLVNPIKMNWKPGAAFITPPAWWHSHHNESDEDAVVIPVQDAGLQTYLRTLFIKFSS